MIKSLTGQRMEPRGSTLIEISMTMIILSVAVISVLGIYGDLAGLRETGRNMNQAVLDAQTVLEMMRENAESGLDSVTATDWTAWASANDLISLSEEAVTVSYADATADPLNVTVQVAWTERRRSRSASLQSFITQR